MPNEEEEEVHLETKVKIFKYNQIQYVELSSLFCILSELRSEASRLGWEQAILDPLDATLREIHNG